MEGEPGDLHDGWELLHSPESSVEAHDGGFDGIENDPEGMIRADYFSIDGSKLYAKPHPTNKDPTDSAESDNPSWVDPGHDSQLPGRNSGELWSSSGSNFSDERKFEGLGTKDGDLGLGLGLPKLGEFGAKSEIVASDHESASNQFWSDSGGNQSEVLKFDADESRAKQKDLSDEAESEAVEKVKEVEGETERRRRRIAWWKVPFEVLRYCVLRVGPVWSFSMAAAMVGLVILGRRLHRMKQKSRALQLKVTLDDKKVSQFKSRAERLNEAFSVVRRVPVVRPALPGPAAAVSPPWPMMSLR